MKISQEFVRDTKKAAFLNFSLLSKASLAEDEIFTSSQDDQSSKLKTPKIMACYKHNNWNFRNDMHPPLSLWDCDPQGKTHFDNNSNVYFIGISTCFLHF